MWKMVAAVALGGAAGALLRWFLTGRVQAWAGGGFPWGTFAVNMIGCLCFGLIISLGDCRINFSPEARALLLTGFMGALTTFSTFVFDTHGLALRGSWIASFGNAAGQTVLGLGCFFIGLAAGRLGM